MAGKRFGHDDIVRVAKQVSGVDVGPQLQRIVQSETMPDQHGSFAAIGLQLEQYPLLETFLLPDPKARPAARQRFNAIFGKAVSR
ncbi:MAG: hypothetical protein V4631_04140 [Pseudomonadota bacterium]